MAESSEQKDTTTYTAAAFAWVVSAPFGFALGFLVFPFALLDGWVSFKLWNIFILPTIGRALPIAFFIGVGLLYNLFAKARTSKSDRTGARALFDLATASVAYPLGALGIAYGAAWWMGLPR
jgi:Zn-dependent protease with chaperone function